VRAAAVILVLLAAPAAADPIVLPRGAIQAELTVEASLSSRERFEPVSLAPDLWYGVTDRLTLGLTTSARAVSRVDAGLGLCVRSDDHGCPRLYDDLASDARWRLTPDAALRARLVHASFAPWKPSLRLGGTVRARRGAWTLEGDPHLGLGLYHTDAGNRATLELPAWIRFQLGCRAEGWIRTGVRGELAGFTEKAAIAVGLGGEVHLGRGVDVGAEVAFPSLLGPQNQFRTRSAFVYVSLVR
jgi:hypothetical protein